MSRPEDPDRMLVAQALSGSATAWEALVDRYGALVYSTIRKAGVPRSEAEDVAQEVFQQLLRSLGTVREIERLAGWIATVASREAWRSNRNARRLRVQSGDAREREANRDDEAGALERRSLVSAALGAIDERCQALLRIMFLSGEEQGYSAVAKQFGITENSVGPIRNRCLRRLLAVLEELGFEPSEHGFSESARVDRTDGRARRT